MIKSIQISGMKKYCVNQWTDMYNKKRYKRLDKD